MKDLDSFIDKWGMITVKSGDGGDSHANMFTMFYCLHMLAQYPKQISAWNIMPLLEGPNRIPIRHPDPDKWYSHEDRCSRDQFLPLLYFVSANRSAASDDRFKELFWLHAKRGFLFAWNTKKNFVYPTLEEHLAKSTPDVKWNYKWKVPDITGPETWATWIRGLGNRAPLRPLAYLAAFVPLCILDLENLVGSCIKWYKWKYKKSKGTGRDGIDHDDRNHALGTHFANKIFPTPVSWLSKRIYGKERPLACFKTFWNDQKSEPPMDLFMKQLY